MTHAILEGFRSPPSFAPTPVVFAFVPVFNGTSYGKQAAIQLCNVARTIHLALCARWIPSPERSAV